MNKQYSKNKGPNINTHISADPVRLIDGSGEMVGVVSIAEALKKSTEAGLDLVEIVADANPPVCKLMDYGKHRFESQKKQKDSRKKQKIVHIKETKLRPNIGEHDYQVKLKNSRKFIENGDKVKVTLRFRGREITHQNIAEDLFNRFFEDISDIAKTELEPKMEGRQMLMILVPIAN